MNKYNIILFIVLVLLAGCTNKRTNSSKSSSPKPIENKRDSTVVQKNYDKIIETEEKAKYDLAYKHSEDYRYAMETYHRRIAEKTSNLNHVEQLLYEYEIAINSLYEIEKETKKHPELLKKQEIQQKLSDRGEKALKLHDELNTYHMTQAEQKRFAELNKKKC